MSFFNDIDGNNKFWLGIWAIIGGVVCVISIVTSLYWVDHNMKIVKLIDSGIDPVGAMCAMQNDFGKHPTCIILATKAK